MKRFRLRLIQRREMWVLTAQGWAILLFLLISALTFILANVHPFLSVNLPIKADVLVVEGWVPDYAVEDALTEFKKGNYRQLITTGVPVGKGYYLAQYNNFADLTAAALIAQGFDKNKVISVPANYTLKNRTAAAAFALRQWLLTVEPQVKAVNLFSVGTHTRRSWIIFKKLLSPEIQVGAIAAEPQDYNAKLWWQSSEGVRTVIGEVIGYIYAVIVNAQD